MSATNSTTNYALSQFLGTDKPAWLSDYNADMGKIDAQMKLNADAATAATGASTANASAIGTLSNLTTTAKTSLVAAVNEVDSHADTAQSTANTASTTANAAKTKADGLETYFNLSGRQNITVTSSVGTVTAGSKISSAYNSNGSLGKIYGLLAINYSSTPSTTVVTIADTGLRPASEITISGLVQSHVYTAQGYSFGGTTDIKIKTNGQATITLSPSSITTSYTLVIPPCLLFMQNFGD